jgi:hypothetical protein
LSRFCPGRAIRDHGSTEEQKTFSQRAAAFLQTGTGLITAVATLLVAVTGLVTAVTQLRGGEEKDVSEAVAGTGPVVTGVPADEADAELWSRIPAGLRTTCRRSTDQEAGAISAYNCTYRRVVGLQYNLFASTGELEDGFAEVKERYGVRGSGATCADGEYEGPYRGSGTMLCFVGDDGVAAVVWTDPEVDILSFSWRNDGKLAELYDAWKTGVGPER